MFFKIDDVVVVVVIVVVVVVVVVSVIVGGIVGRREEGEGSGGGQERRVEEGWGVKEPGSVVIRLVLRVVVLFGQGVGGTRERVVLEDLLNGKRS